MLNLENDLISYNVNDLLSDCIDLTLNKNSSNEDEKLVRLVIESYSKNTLDIPLVNIINNDNKFRIYLLSYVQTKIKKVMKDSSIFQFKELIDIVNLLSFGKNYKIFEKYNEYSEKGISSILRDYEQKLKDNFESNKEEFEILFNYYMTLLDSLNELCIINTMDILRKKKIKIIIDLLTESINLLKFSIKLDEKKITYLSSFQGKQLLLFSNLDQNNIIESDIKGLISIFSFNFNKQIDGYFLIAGENNFTSKFFPTFLLNTSKLLLLMLKKLDSLGDTYFDKLKDIIDLYNKYCLKDNISITSSNDFKKSLLNNLFILYSDDSIDNEKQIINIILQKDEISLNEYIILHELVLYLDSIKKEDLFNIVKKLILIKKAQNDFIEDNKLKVIDAVINVFINNRDFDDKTSMFIAIKKYLYITNTATHLISTFSKIHLSISLYYSFLDEKNIVLSQKEYFTAEKICAFTQIKDEYKDIYVHILYNNAIRYLSKNSLANKFSNMQLINFSHNLMKEYFISEEKNIKLELHNSLSNIIEHILTNTNYSKEKLENEICSTISKNVFFGLCTCYILKKNEFNNKFNEIGFDILKQDLVNDYIIVYKYSYSYYEAFNVVFNKNNTFIKNVITNLILSYTMKNELSNYAHYLKEDKEFLSVKHKFEL